MTYLSVLAHVLSPRLLGRCPRCMRLAFLAFAGAGLAAGLLRAAHLPGAVAAGGLALGLCLLWIAHGWAFTRRALRATARLHAPGRTPPAPAPAPWTRRRVVAAFLRVMVFSALSAALPRTALAQSCNCYTESDCYCPPDFPLCIYNPTTGEAICCGADAVGCAGPVYTWCCPYGTNCYGAENQCY